MSESPKFGENPITDEMRRTWLDDIRELDSLRAQLAARDEQLQEVRADLERALSCWANTRDMWEEHCVFCSFGDCERKHDNDCLVTKYGITLDEAKP